MPFIGGEDKKPPHKPEPFKKPSENPEDFLGERSSRPTWELIRELDRNSKTRSEIAAKLGVGVNSPKFKKYMEILKERVREFGSKIERGEVRSFKRNMSWDARHRLEKESEGGLNDTENLDLDKINKLFEDLKERL